MVVIEKHRDVGDSPEFKALAGKLTGQSRLAWNQVKRIAFAQDTGLQVTGADSQLLLRIRNNLAFH
jgi:hypothetical protein